MARVLVIEDDADIRGMIAEALSLEGYVVAEAGDGVEGLERARERRPDVILLDLMMPRMDGHGFREQQVRDPALATVPVVIVSACPDDRMHGPPAAGHLRKPFDLEDLLAMVGRISVASVS